MGSETKKDVFAGVQGDGLYRFVNKKKVYLLLISLDFTYLNKKFGYEVTNALKRRILEILDGSHYIFFKDLGSKLLLIFDSDITGSMKSDVDREIASFLLKTKGFVQPDPNTRLALFTTSEFGDFDLSFENRFALFEKAYETEKYLKELRGKVQAAFKKGDTRDVEELQNKIRVLEQVSSKVSPDYTDYKRLMKEIRNSVYLTKAAEALFGSKKDLDVFFSNMVEYFFWLKLQEILLDDFKKEKIYRFFDPTRLKAGEPENVKKIDDLRVWYDSSIALFYPFLNSEEKALADEINRFVEDPSEDRKSVEEMMIKIYALTKRLDVKGHLNLPMTSLYVSRESDEFQRRQFFLQFGKEGFEEVLKGWRRSKFVKGKFPLACDASLDNFVAGFFFLNGKTLDRLGPEKKVFLSVAFLEMDGFNAFNKYLFPTDSDKVYASMVNKVFEVADRFILKFPDVFKSMTVYILGDEFFFAFLHSDPEADRVIKEYLTFFRDETLKLVSDVQFIRTDKTVIDLKGTDLVVRNAVRVDKKGLFGKREIGFELAHLGISGFGLFCKPVSSEDWISVFKGMVKSVEAGVDEIKTNRKGRLEFKKAA
jgi:hypothetical protein